MEKIYNFEIIEGKSEVFRNLSNEEKESFKALFNIDFDIIKQTSQENFLKFLNILKTVK